MKPKCLNRTVCFRSRWFLESILEICPWQPTWTWREKSNNKKKSLDDESVKQNEQHLTAHSSIHLVAVNKTLAAQSIPVQLWPILDILDAGKSNSPFRRCCLHAGYLSANWARHRFRLALERQRGKKKYIYWWRFRGEKTNSSSSSSSSSKSCN